MKLAAAVELETAQRVFGFVQGSQVSCSSYAHARCACRIVGAPHHLSSGNSLCTNTQAEHFSRKFPPPFRPDPHDVGGRLHPKLSPGGGGRLQEGGIYDREVGGDSVLVNRLLKVGHHCLLGREVVVCNCCVVHNLILQWKPPNNFSLQAPPALVLRRSEDLRRALFAGGVHVEKVHVVRGVGYMGRLEGVLVDN